jgi:hypothetical protein
MSNFLQFAINKQPECLTRDGVIRWAGALDNWSFYNTVALEIAIGW